MFRGSGWVYVGLVWAGREYAWEAPQMGLHHAWLALKDPAFLPTTSALSPSPPCHQAVFQVKVGSSHNVSFMIAAFVWFCDKIKLPMLHWQKRNADYLHWQSHSCRRCCWSVSTCGMRQPENIFISYYFLIFFQLVERDNLRLLMIFISSDISICAIVFS